MWAVEHSEDTPATPDVVWRRYADVESWPERNAAVGQMHLTGPFATGTTGTLTPPGQGPLPFRVVEATVDQGYTSETDIAETVTNLPVLDRNLLLLVTFSGSAQRAAIEQLATHTFRGLPRGGATEGDPGGGGYEDGRWFSPRRSGLERRWGRRSGS